MKTLILICLTFIIQEDITTVSYYSDKHHGKNTASGEKFDMNKLTAAHKTLPFGTKIKVTNVNNGKSVVVIINDRGPFKKTPDFKYYTRVLDLAKGAFLKIASAGAGVIKIKYEILE